MIVFIDFDDVIFNTQQFKDDLKKVFRDSGVSNEEYIRYYFPLDADVPKTYDPRAQIERICAHVNVPKEPLQKAVEAFLEEECTHYVFPDVAELAAAVGSNNLVIVSFGDKRMQEEKIERSGVKNIIAQVIVTENQKSAAIAEYVADRGIQLDEAYFIDDRVEQIGDIKKVFPNIKTIFLKRLEGRYQEQKRDACCDYEAHSLHEVVGIIKGSK